VQGPDARKGPAGQLDLLAQCLRGDGAGEGQQTLWPRRGRDVVAVQAGVAGEGRTDGQVFRDLLYRNGPPWPQLDRKFFDADRLTRGGFSSRFYDQAGIKAGETLSPEIKADLAASLQAVIQEAVIGMIGPAENVCIAGGLALNFTP